MHSDDPCSSCITGYIETEGFQTFLKGPPAELESVRGINFEIRKSFKQTLN
jgi:hypothetical protein